MVPPTHRALTVRNEPKELYISERPIPAIQDDEILIKVRAVTLNPTDWKHFEFGFLQDGSSLGSDYAGDVVAIGKEAEGKGFKIGDAVASYTRGGYIDPTNGAFQEYIKAYPELVWPIPKDVLSYEDAAAMGGISLSTAIQALFHRLKLPTPWEPAKEPFPIVIWAGATSVGIYAIKLAKLAGLQVATTASPKNHEFMKELGADVVFDYRDPETPKKIKEWSGGKIAHGLDNISEQGTTKLAAECFGDEGGQVIALLPVKQEELGDSRVEVIRILIYSALKKSNIDDFTNMAEWYKLLPRFAEQLKVMPLRKWPGGLEAIPEALDYLKAGKASAEKISLEL